MRLLFLSLLFLFYILPLSAQYLPVSEDTFRLYVPQFLIDHPEVARVVEYESVKTDRKIATKMVQNTYTIDRPQRRILFEAKSRGGYFLASQEINYTDDWRILEVNKYSKDGERISTTQFYYDTIKNIRQSFVFQGDSFTKMPAKGDSLYTYKRVEYFNKKNHLARLIRSGSRGDEKRYKNFYRYKYRYDSENRPLKMEVYQYDKTARNPKLFAEHTYGYYREKEVEKINWLTYEIEKEINKTFKDGFLHSMIIKEDSANTLIQYFYESGYISGIEIQTDRDGKIATNYRNYEYYFN